MKNTFEQNGESVKGSKQVALNSLNGTACFDSRWPTRTKINKNMTPTKLFRMLNKLLQAI